MLVQVEPSQVGSGRAETVESVRFMSSRASLVQFKPSRSLRPRRSSRAETIKSNRVESCWFRSSIVRFVQGNQSQFGSWFWVWPSQIGLFWAKTVIQAETIESSRVILVQVRPSHFGSSQAESSCWFKSSRVMVVQIEPSKIGSGRSSRTETNYSSRVVSSGSIYKWLY